MDNSGKERYVRIVCLLIPRAAEVLRSVFCNTWKKANDQNWEGTPEEAIIFETGRGKQVLANTSLRQKKLLTSGNIDLWNLKLMSHVLKRMDFGSANLKPQEKKQIQTLADERYKILHLNEHSLSDDEYNEIWNRFENILVSLGASFSDLIELKYMNLEEELNKIPTFEVFDKINSVEIKKRCKSIIETSSKYLSKPSLSKLERAACYISRSKAFLASFPPKVNEAKDDAKNAITLKPTWTHAYDQLANVYKFLNSTTKVTSCLDISQTLKSNCCLLMQPAVESCDKDETSKLKISDQKLSTEIEGFVVVESKNKKFTNEKLEQLKAEICENSESAIGLYYLAVMFNEGQGNIPRDSIFATTLLREAVAKPAVIDGKSNPGVAESEHALACNYTIGKGGIAINIDQAIKWFIKASSHGHLDSYNNLGSIHFVHKKDNEKAVEFWQLGASAGNIFAMHNLAFYYLLNEKNTEKALEWHKRALDKENIFSLPDFSLFDEKTRLLKNVHSIFKQKESQWAEADSIDADKSLQIQKLRFVNKNPATKVIGDHSNSEMFMPMTYTTCNYSYHLSVLEHYSSQGSLTARLLKKGVIHFIAAIKLLDKFKSKCPPTFISQLSECLRIDRTIPSWSSFESYIAMRVAAKSLSNDDEKSKLDKDARICHAYFHANAFTDMKNFLQKCIQKYDDEIFYIMLSNTLCLMSDHVQGLQVASQGLQKFPGNGELLYIRACALKFVPEKHKEMIKAFQKFLNYVPVDHPKVPEAYYIMAYECLNETTVDVKKIVNYYCCGLNAEKNQLPCFLPCDCPLKVELEEKMKEQAFANVFLSAKKIVDLVNIIMSTNC